MKVERGVPARKPCGPHTLHINSQRKTPKYPTPSIRIADATRRIETIRSTRSRTLVERGVSARKPCGPHTLHINSQWKTPQYPTPYIRIADATRRIETIRSTRSRTLVERGVPARNPCGPHTLHINSQRKTPQYPSPCIQIAVTHEKRRIDLACVWLDTALDTIRLCE